MALAGAASSRAAASVDARAGCLVCGSTEHQRLFDLEGARIARCRRCGLVQQLARPETPSAIYDAAYYASDHAKGGYANYFLDADINRRTFDRRLRRIEARAARLGRLLDVGCALGDFVLAAQAAGWAAEGVEVSGFAAAAARRRGATVHVGDVRALSLEPGAYEVVTLYDTIEHVDDPVATLREVRRLLASGGTVHLVTPNVAGIQARILGRRWYHYKPDEHLSYFSPGTLRRAVEDAGLRWDGWSRTGSYVTVSYVLNRLRHYARAPFALLERASRAVGLSALVFYLYVGEMEAWAHRDA